jgi:hypothetical protein
LLDRVIITISKGPNILRAFVNKNHCLSEI